MIVPPSRSLPAPVPEVMFQALEDGAVLFSPATELYFGLNHVGAAIWLLLPPTSHTLDELCASLRRLYPDASDVELTADVTALLDELARERLVVGASSTGAPRRPV